VSKVLAGDATLHGGCIADHWVDSIQLNDSQNFLID
jgi:predicted enzyme involved in methoxymalonyl-ACP biosynthesis